MAGNNGSKNRAGAKLIADVEAFVRRYVVMTDAQHTAVALWIVHSHLIGTAEQTPYLAITSPEKQCGKTRLMEVLELLVSNPWLVELPTEAVLYRNIHFSAPLPTLLWDEIDTVFNPKTQDRYEAQRAVINAGNRRGVTVPRMVGEKIANFRVFSAKALAGIGTLPSTVADRSIPIRLARRKKNEPVERLRRRDAEATSKRLRGRIEKWARENEEALTEARPDLPPELSDRMQDACEPLLAIADLVGGNVPEKSRAALIELTTHERADDIETMRLRLLRDLKAIFGDGLKLSTATILRKLHELPEAGWTNYYGHPLDPRDLAKLLGHYGIKSRRLKVKVGGKPKVLQGYRSADLYDAWERYL